MGDVLGEASERTREMGDESTDEAVTGGGDTMGTGRLEAFSDGVFAIAITLLVLDLHVPDVGDGPGGMDRLLAALGHLWPQYVAYVVSFTFILIMWVNHHGLLRVVRRANHAILLANGVLLMFITLVPFPTSLLSTNIRSPGASNVAAAVYAGNYVLIALSFNVFWYVVRHSHLLDDRLAGAPAIGISRSYRLGPLWYGVAFVLAFLSVPACIVVTFALSIFYALPQAWHSKPLRERLPLGRSVRSRQD